MEENKKTENANGEATEEKTPVDFAEPEAEKAEAPKSEKKKAKKTDSELNELKKKVEKAENEVQEVNDRYMRMIAEYDNFRKRSAKEKEGVYADAYADCIGNILPILDNLERAGKSDNFEAVKKGLEMTARAFEDALEKMGIEEVETKTFDPNLHNAVMHIEDESFGESEIVEVFQKGYIKGDKVIRYAMVKVAN